MTLIDTSPGGPVTAEQIYEIRTIAESGQFADALIRLRKIKPLHPRNTFLVALEKQLERLRVLPRDSEPTEPQRKELMNSMPGLVKGAVDSLRQQPPARLHAEQDTTPPAKSERPDRDAARNQLKEQYFQHADEYLKKGAYGSALVEIRRVKIIAPDDPTVVEYERTIRQLVELQQRIGIRSQEAIQTPSAEQSSPNTGVEASPTPTPQVREYDLEASPPPEFQSATVEPSDIQAPRKSRLGPIVAAVLLVLLLCITALALFSSPDDSAEPADKQEATIPTGTGNMGVRVQPGQDMPAPSVGSAAALAPTQQKTETVASPVQERHPGAETPVQEKEATSASPLQAQLPGAVTPIEKQKATPAVPVQKKLSDAVTPTLQKNAAPPIPAQEKPLAAARPASTAYTESDPQILHLEQPVFPPELVALKEGGEVIIMVQIDPAGKPLQAMVAKTTNMAYNDSITKAVMNSTYRPGTTADGPTTKWITIPFKIK